MLLPKSFHHKIFVEDRMKRVAKLKKRKVVKHSLTGLVIDIHNSSLNLVASIIKAARSLGKIAN